MGPTLSGPLMRIGTWNLAGRWDDRHLAMLEDASCDHDSRVAHPVFQVMILTEPPWQASPQILRLGNVVAASVRGPKVATCQTAALAGVVDGVQPFAHSRARTATTPSLLVPRS